jgi:hypothetical protein
MAVTSTGIKRVRNLGISQITGLPQLLPEVLADWDRHIDLLIKHGDCGLREPRSGRESIIRLGKLTCDGKPTPSEIMRRLR